MRHEVTSALMYCVLTGKMKRNPHLRLSAVDGRGGVDGGEMRATQDMESTRA